MELEVVETPPAEVSASIMPVDAAPPLVPSVYDELISEGEAAVVRYRQSRDQILPMACGLVAAKRRFSETQAFGAWLAGSPYSSLCAQDRSALIRIGKALDRHEPEIVEFLARTHLVSPQTIWTAIAEMLGLVAGDADDVADVSPDAKLQRAREHARAMNALYDLAQQNKAKAPSEAGAGNDADDDDAAAPARPSSPTIDASCYLSNSTKRSPTEVRPRQVATPADASKGLKAPDEKWNSGERFDLVLLTPSDDDVRLLRNTESKWLGECLPVHRIVEDDVAVVVDTTVGDLPVIAEFLLPLFGFTPGNRPRVLMVRRPDAPNVTDARVLVAIERGVDFSPPEGWSDGDDALALAELLYRDVSRSLLLFGSTDGTVGAAAPGTRRRACDE
jgi:hypothetical protein